MEPQNPYLLQLIERIEKGERHIPVFGLEGSARGYFLARFLEETQRPCLIVLPRGKDAKQFYRELEFFLPHSMHLEDSPERRLYDFPLYDLSPLSGLSPHRDVVTRRIQALYSLTAQRHPIVVTSSGALRLKGMPAEALVDALVFLKTEQEIDREALLARFQANGFIRTSLVEERGDFSLRGSVLDIYPPLYPDPLRLEFWGDRLESIRSFDPLSQRSKATLTEAVLLPANEVIMDPERVKRARSFGRLPRQYQESGGFPGQEGWMNHFYTNLSAPFDFLPDDGLIFLIEPRHIQAEIEQFTRKFNKDVTRYREEAEARQSPFPEVDGVLVGEDEIQGLFESRQRVSLMTLDVEGGDDQALPLRIEGVTPEAGDLGLRLAVKGRVSIAPLAERISGWLEQRAMVALVCRTEQQAGRLADILENYNVQVEDRTEEWSQLSRTTGLVICLGRLPKGFGWPELGIYLISEDEIFGAKRSLARAKKEGVEGGLNWTSFSQLKEGDMVVHQDHGIGRYGGLQKMEVHEKINDFAIIEYAGKDKLYIPADRISILQKYVGADERSPRLDRLGGQAWEKVKAGAKKSVREIAKQLVEIYAIRKYRRGFAFSPPDNTFREFEARFEHEETADQIKAIDAVLTDMEKDQPMDRLICGDVGFGKTEVAIRAAFKAVMDGKQVAFLVPTTVLAEQHHETFRKRMSDFDIRVGVLSRFKSRSEQKDLIARIRSHQLDIVIGTHRILQKDVTFKDLGLLIIDEEQRFGVKQKEALKKYRSVIDVLALTATPIPRTLHLSLMGIRDLSIIETPPEDRLAIQTYLSPYDEPTVVRAVESELERGGQVFFVHNQVKSIDHVADRLRQLVPRARFAVAHGQMRARELEETMLRFVHGEVDCLVCTTIIESGLDIPSVNTILINEIDKFGLAQIYQLRGRVGRGKENAYAYLLLSMDGRLTRDAEKRIRALMDFSQLGAGVHLAMHDLKIRGGGNILGFSQSGHITAIGYELYLKLVERAVAELKGEEWHEEINPEINVDVSAYLPADFVADTDVRLNLYRRLSSLREEEDLETMTGEMKDRFGPFPKEVTNLLKIMSVRLLMKRTGIIRLDANRDSLVFTFSRHTVADPERLIALAKGQRGSIRFLSEDKCRMRTLTRAPIKALDAAKEIIQALGRESGIHPQ